MHQENTSGGIGNAIRALCVLAITAVVGLISYRCGFNFAQITSASVFTLIISAALFFWDLHLPIALLGIALLMILDVMDLPSLVVESKLDIILFLMGLMVIVGILKEVGLFSWIILTVISVPTMTARRFVFTYCAIGALMSCMVDEVTSIVFIAALIFQVCDTLNIKPVPFIIMAVMMVNIGSAGTMLGNPVGIFIGQNAQPPLSFNDFMIWSFPIMVAEFTAAFLFMLWSFRREIREMDEGLRQRREMGLSLGPIVEVPYLKGLLILVVLILCLSMHTVFERWLTLPRNTMLIITPLLISGVLMLWRRQQIRKYIENDVEWLTLIFFMMLFVVAGTLEHTKVTVAIADGFHNAYGDRPDILLPVILGISAIGSAFIENIIFVAAFMPVVVKLEETPLLWALLHGACLGGNITMIGSTANIAAVGLLEKRYWTLVNFFTWLKTGLAVGVISCLVAWAGLALTSEYMPTLEERRQEASLRQIRYEQEQDREAEETPPAPAANQE